jgi:hypothetical protein
MRASRGESEIQEPHGKKTMLPLQLHDQIRWAVWRIGNNVIVRDDEMMMRENALFSFDIALARSTARMGEFILSRTWYLRAFLAEILRLPSLKMRLIRVMVPLTKLA